MSTMTIPNIDAPLTARLQARAALHGRSMEEEARNILHTALSAESGSGLVEAIRARVASLGGIDLELPTREPIRPHAPT